MNTPICDFVKAYAAADHTRLHMPGHKGVSVLGCEARDITEIPGADVLYHAAGIIRRSEENAAALFGTARTVYSTEGSSLCIRGMLYLAMQHTGRRLILAGRNAHSTFVTAAALLDMSVQWLYGAGQGLTTCAITADALATALDGLSELPAAVYLTSPDYLGNTLDIATLAAVCHARDVLLLVDNAHGAYLRFLRQDRHPISLGADLCCDSAHKTLPVLTGGAYLHIAHRAAVLAEQAEHALSLFASTSPSYLILQSLDAANPYLETEAYRLPLFLCVSAVEEFKEALTAHGYTVVGDEPLKVTLATKGYGYRGDAVAAYLQQRGFVCEFADPDYLVMMVTPAIGSDAIQALQKALLALPRKEAQTDGPPPLFVPTAAMSLREALLAPAETVSLRESVGRILATPTVGCPPAVPILVGGEVVDQAAARLFAYYGYDTLRVVKA